MKRLYSLLLSLTLVLPCVSSGQTYDLQFLEVLNNGTNFDVKVQIKSNGSTFGMGSGNLVFTFNTAAINTPVLQTAHNFSGSFYSAMSVTTPAAGRVSINIELLLSNSGTTVLAAYMDVATIRFTIANPAGNTGLQWRTSTPNRTNAFKDDNATEVAYGTFHNFDQPLPIQLASFTAATVGNNHVRLDWRTLTETNNYGFEVQKASGQPFNYQSVPNSFVPGQGTTVEPHDYTYTDSAVVSGLWYYRLKQIDLDGTVYFSDGVQVDVLTSVDDRPVPTEFALDQNYPNPFNPSTQIEFALPGAAHVRLEVFNVIGERVAMLVDEVRQVGYHKVRFDGKSLSSGLYFYRLSAGERSFLRKMVLVK